MVLKVILALIVLVNGGFAIRFIQDVMKNRAALKEENGSPVAMSISQFCIYFLSTFGISDFAIGAALYPKAKWVEDKKLPGTLNTACVIPVAAMALIYISSIEVDLLTLIVPIIAQVLGSYLSPRYVVKLPALQIKKLVMLGLFVAAGVILAGKLQLMPIGAEKTVLDPGMLSILAILSFIYGAMNNMGIGSYALTMATVYAMGLSPAVAFPIMMGACTFSVPVGGMQFIKLDSYSRKITLFSATAGVVGVLVAAFLVKSLNTSALQYVILGVILYSALSMLNSIRKS